MPLTVGYLWLTVGWTLWGDSFPDRSSEGPIARLYRLSDFLGDAAAIASTSFAAYLAGAMLTLPLEGRIGRRLLLFRSDASPLRFDEPFGYYPTRDGELLSGWRPGWRSPDYERVDSPDDYTRFRIDLIEDILRIVPEPQFAFGRAVNDAISATPEDLRPRLLSAEAGKEIYGEYDRAAAEAAFRVNVVPPLTVLGVVAACYLWVDYSKLAALGMVVATLSVAATLLIQGVSRLHAATLTIQRAAMIGVFKHPLEELRDRGQAGQGA